jgi:hypothetical protein
VASLAQESWEGFWRIISKTVVSGGYMVTLVTRVRLAEGLAGRQFNIISPAMKRSNFAPYYRYQLYLSHHLFLETNS